MSTIGIIDVFDKIQPSKGDYCKICFRTSRERKLVTPVFFQRFLRTVNILNTAYKTEIKVCYICEHLATSAIKFYNAVLFGIDLEEIFGWVQQPGIREYVVDNLTPGIRMSQSNAKMHRTLNLEKQYQKYHDSLPYSLKCTNTLLVNIENDDPKATMGSSAQTATDNDVILVLDSDLPLLTPNRPPHPVRLETNEHTPMENQLMLHPMITGADGRIYVPSLKLQMNDTELQMVPNQNFQNLNPQPQWQHKMDKKIEQLTVSTSYEDFIRQFETQNTSNEIITTEGMNIVLNFDDNDSGSKKTRYEELEKDPLDIAVNDDLCANNIGPKHDNHVNRGVKMKDCEKEKLPLLSTGRVDWEDKIPMDVISFMDATDPNPVERIMQPNTPTLGFISDVRSIESTEEEDVQIIDTVECIDLC